MSTPFATLRPGDRVLTHAGRGHVLYLRENDILAIHIDEAGPSDFCLDDSILKLHGVPHDQILHRAIAAATGADATTPAQRHSAWDALPSSARVAALAEQDTYAAAKRLGALEALYEGIETAAVFAYQCEKDVVPRVDLEDLLDDVDRRQA